MQFREVPSAMLAPQQSLSISGFPDVLLARITLYLTLSAEDFLQMLTQKIDNLRASTADTPLPQCSCTEFKFESFQPILENELHRLIKSSNLKSSELDPLPHLF